MMKERYLILTKYSDHHECNNPSINKCIWVQTKRQNMDLDKQDFYGSNNGTDERARAFERDYGIALEDQSIGRVIRYFGICVGMAILMIIGV